FAEELLAAATLGWHSGRLELVIIDAADQQRQLRAEVRGQIDREAIAELVEDRRQHLPGKLLVRPKIVADLVEPNVGDFDRPVEYVEAARAHCFTPRFGSRMLRERPAHAACSRD